MWQQQEQDRLSRPNRQRAIGGGRKYELKFREQLLMTLVWLHDLKHFRCSGAGEQIPKDATVAGDAGYDGLGNDLPDHSVVTSFKARRKPG